MINGTLRRLVVYLRYRFSSRQNIKREAAIWMMRLSDENVTDEEKLAWQNWCARSVEHKKMGRRAERLHKILSEIHVDLKEERSSSSPSKLERDS